jgi:hypothetical protein
MIYWTELHAWCGGIWLLLSLITLSWAFSWYPVRFSRRVWFIFLWAATVATLVSGLGGLPQQFQRTAQLFVLPAGWIVLAKGLLFSFAVGVQTVMGWKVFALAGLGGSAESPEETPSEVREFAQRLARLLAACHLFFLCAMLALALVGRRLAGV